MTTSYLTCPECHEETESLKHYDLVKSCWFFGWARIRMEPQTACPQCMRRSLWRRCLATMLTANVLWLVWVLPRTIILSCCTLAKGHSRRIRETLYLSQM